MILVFQKSVLLLPLAPTVETRATELRFTSRCPLRHLVHGGLAFAAATLSSWIEQRKSRAHSTLQMLQSDVGAEKR